MGALSDTLVVSLEQAVAAPYCTRLLAEAGCARDQGRASRRRFRAAL